MPGGPTARRALVMCLGCINWWRGVEVVLGRFGKKDNPMSSFATILTGIVT
jgi:hypothetical protein